jgi:hypothetical protein
MKIQDLLSKTVKESSIDEAPFNIGQPMGAMKTMGNKVMAKLGSQTAQGKLQSGDTANQLSNSLKQFMGRTGQKQITADVLMSFLQQNGYPTDGAEKIIADFQKKSAGAVPQGNAPVAEGELADRSQQRNSGVAPAGTPQPPAGTPQAPAQLPQDVINKALMAAVQGSAKMGGFKGSATAPGNQQAAGTMQGGQQQGGSVEARLAKLEKLMGVAESKKR